MGRTGSILAVGLVTIGLATALTLPGRQTAQAATGFGNAGAHLFSTVITGKR